MVVSVCACGVGCGVAPKRRFPVCRLPLISQGPEGCSLGGLRLRQTRVTFGDPGGQRSGSQALHFQREAAHIGQAVTGADCRRQVPLRGTYYGGR